MNPINAAKFENCVMIVYYDKASAGLLIEWKGAIFRFFPDLVKNSLKSLLTSPKFSVKSLRESLTLDKLTIFYQIYIFCSILEQQHSKFAQRSNCTAQRAPWFDEFFNPLSIQLKSNALKNGTLTLRITELLLLFFFEVTIFSAFFSTAGELKRPLI